MTMTIPLTYDQLTESERKWMCNGCGPKLGIPVDVVPDFAFHEACNHFGVVYCLHSPSGRIYVGQTIDLRHRLDVYRRGHFKRQPKLCRAVAKHGWFSFAVSVVAVCSDQADLDAAERYWIAKLNTVRDGYNCVLGGLGGAGRRHRASSIRKMRTKKLGAKNSMWGKTHSPEARAKISAAHKGRRLSVQEVARLRRLHRGKPKTLAHRAKIAASKCIFVYTMTAPTGDIFSTDNLKVFCAVRGLSRWGMSEVACGRKHESRGWKVARVFK